MVTPPSTPLASDASVQEDYVGKWNCYVCDYTNYIDISTAVFCDNLNWEPEIGSRMCIMCLAFHPITT